MKFPLAIIVILFASLYAFYPSFNLAVFGDFWVTLRRYQLIVGELSPGYWNHFSYLHTLYGSQDILTGLLSKIYGFDSFDFYFTSYILRLIAAFSFYPVVLYLTKNKFSSFFAVLFFSISTIGLETTNWVFNLSSYLTVAFFNSFLYFLLKSRENSHQKKFLIACLLFYATIISSPIRTTGLLPFIFIVELYWLWGEFSSKTLKKALIRLFIISLIFIFLMLKTHTFSTPPWDSPFIAPAPGAITSKTLKSLENIQPNSLLYPLIILGGAFSPNLTGNMSLIYLSIGGIVIILWFFLITFYRKSKYSAIIFISLTWYFSSFIIPWIWNQESLFQTTHRYFIVSTIGIAFFLSALLTIKTNNLFRNFIFIIAFLILLTQIYTTHHYFVKLLSVRNLKLYNRVWSKMPSFPEVGHTKEPLVFYFDGDNAEIVFNIINFGFPQKIELINKVQKENSLVSALNFEELISAVKDGKSLTKHLLPEQPVPFTNIYSFYLKEDGNLIDTSNNSREELKKLIE